MSFINRSGVAAQDMKVDLSVYDAFSGGTTINGSATGPFTPGGG